MDTFAFWCDKPFDPRLISKKGRLRLGIMAIRYRGSVGRSAILALIVLGLLAIILNIVG